MLQFVNLLVSTVARNSGNCNLIACVGCYDCMVVILYVIIVQ